MARHRVHELHDHCCVPCRPARKLTRAAAGGSTSHPWSDCKYSSRPPATKQASRLPALLLVQLPQHRFDVCIRDAEHARWAISRSRNLHKQKLRSSCPYLIKCGSSTFLERSRSSSSPSVIRRSFLLPVTTWAQRKSPSNASTTFTSTSPPTTLLTSPANHGGAVPPSPHIVLAVLRLVFRQDQEKSGTQKAACSLLTPWTRH